MTTGEVLVYDMNLNKKDCSSMLLLLIISSTLKIQWIELSSDWYWSHLRLQIAIFEGIFDANQKDFTWIMGVQYNL